MLRPSTHHDCDHEDCGECPVCDVCSWCRECTDCSECICPSSEADELLSWLENRRDVCRNCFLTVHRDDAERGYVEDERHHLYEEEFHDECGCGQRGTPAAAERWWGADEPDNLPLPPADGLTFTEVLDRVLGRLEVAGVEVDRDEAFGEGKEWKRTALWSKRDRDCILFALDASVDFEGLPDGIG